MGNETGEPVAVHPAGTASVNLTSCRVGAPAGLGSEVVTVKLPPGSASVGDETVNGDWTTIGALPVTPLTVALTVAVPWLRAVTMPAELTVATRVSLLR